MINPGRKPAVGPTQSEQDRQRRKRRESDDLDAALEQTFPASDPVAVFVPQRPPRKQS